MEYLDLIDPLTRPDDQVLAFDVVIPSIPGFGFSGPADGWDGYRTAKAWAELMRRLGYDQYGAVGNDVGSTISLELGRTAPDRVAGVHVTQIFSLPSADPAELNGELRPAQSGLDVSQPGRRRDRHCHRGPDQSADDPRR
ncbi:hypothetical protein GCM10023075_46280 [Streptosporangium album]